MVSVCSRSSQPLGWMQLPLIENSQSSIIPLRPSRARRQWHLQWTPPCSGKWIPEAHVAFKMLEASRDPSSPTTHSFLICSHWWLWIWELWKAYQLIAFHGFPIKRTDAYSCQTDLWRFQKVFSIEILRAQGGRGFAGRLGFKKSWASARLSKPVSWTLLSSTS